jgi:hypothetical protein
MSGTFDLEFLSQKGSLCLLYALLNVLLTLEKRRKFLDMDPSTVVDETFKDKHFEPFRAFVLTFQRHTTSDSKLSSRIIKVDLVVGLFHHR